jgi:hypothetical protein
MVTSEGGGLVRKLPSSMVSTAPSIGSPDGAYAPYFRDKFFVNCSFIGRVVWMSLIFKIQPFHSLGSTKLMIDHGEIM